MDRYSASVHFNFLGGSDTYRTKIGVCVSVFVFLVTMVYTVQNVLVL